MNSPISTNPRLNELLATQAVGSLTLDEQVELDQLMAELPAADRAQVATQYERISGTLAGALHAQSDARLPAELRAKLLAQGTALVAARTPRPTGRILVGPLGWAIAACLSVVATIGMLRTPSAPTPEPATVARGRLIAEHPDTIQLAFTKTGDPAAKVLSGDIVWNQRLQRGYLRLTGLPTNNPSADQYQLWIFDGTRPEYAVDGGVFNAAPTAVVANTGELVIPFDAKLLVRDPAAFAITVEQPGGVVVTKKDRVLALATKPAPTPPPSR